MKNTVNSSSDGVCLFGVELSDGCFDFGDDLRCRNVGRSYGEVQSFLQQGYLGIARDLEDKLITQLVLSTYGVSTGDTAACFSTGGCIATEGSIIQKENRLTKGNKVTKGPKGNRFT